MKILARLWRTGSCVGYRRFLVLDFFSLLVFCSGVGPSATLLRRITTRFQKVRLSAWSTVTATAESFCWKRIASAGVTGARLSRLQTAARASVGLELWARAVSRLAARALRAISDGPEHERHRTGFWRKDSKLYNFQSFAALACFVFLLFVCSFWGSLVCIWQKGCEDPSLKLLLKFEELVFGVTLTCEVLNEFNLSIIIIITCSEVTLCKSRVSSVRLLLAGFQGNSRLTSWHSSVIDYSILHVCNMKQYF